MPEDIKHETKQILNHGASSGVQSVKNIIGGAEPEN